MGAGLACCPSESWGTLMPKPLGPKVGRPKEAPGQGVARATLVTSGRGHRTSGPQEGETRAPPWRGAEQCGICLPSTLLLSCFRKPAPTAAPRFRDPRKGHAVPGPLWLQVSPSGNGSKAERVGFTCTLECRWKGSGRRAGGQSTWPAICSPDSSLSMSHSVECQLLIDGLLCARPVGPVSSDLRPKEV